MKKFMPCLYLYNRFAVKSFNDTTVIKSNPVELAKDYESKGCDGIIVMDLSNNDKEQEAALDVIKSICDSINIPVIGAGNVKRMEDIKKLLYAGCKKAMLNYGKEDNIKLTKEVSDKFGKDKLLASIFNLAELEKYSDKLEKYVSAVFFMTHTSIFDAVKISPLPVLAYLPDMSVEKLLEIGEQKMIEGICGDVVVDNLSSLYSIKEEFEKKGILDNRNKSKLKWSDFKLNNDGHITVVVQNIKTDEVLMVAYMNEEAFNMTMSTGKMIYYSRSRDELWIKGETSGHFQYLQSMYVDCDKDTLLVKVIQEGAACHTGNKSCFYTPICEKAVSDKKNPLKVFEDLYDTISDRKINPKEGSYTNYLFDKGIDKILKKLGEEATEIVIAAKNPNANEIKYEIADFLYHMMVLMAEKNVSWEEITEELVKR